MSFLAVIMGNLKGVYFDSIYIDDAFYIGSLDRYTASLLVTLAKLNIAEDPFIKWKREYDAIFQTTTGISNITRASTPK